MSEHYLSFCCAASLRRKAKKKNKNERKRWVCAAWAGSCKYSSEIVKNQQIESEDCTKLEYWVSGESRRKVLQQLAKVCGAISNYGKKSCVKNMMCQCGFVWLLQPLLLLPLQMCQLWLVGYAWCAISFRKE